MPDVSNATRHESMTDPQIHNVNPRFAVQFTMQLTVTLCNLLEH
jgi:hypothetical protein